MENNYKKILVIGGGIAGVQASLDLADSGVEVYLVEKAPSIGGRMAQLDKTFPTNDCAMCILSPKLVEAGSHPYINIITNADVESVRGEAPHFHVSVLKKPRYVDEEKCTGCGICMAKCPVKITDDYNEGLAKTKCIRIPFPQAVPAVAMIDKRYCIFHQRGKCRICEKFCDAKAIDFNQKEELINLEVGSIILSTGLGEFDAVLKDEYGYKTFPNVLTSIEFERILSASGPTHGHILRPSDGKEPHKIGFIQCVGSRDSQVGNEYCSAICCMQAAKDAIILGEHLSSAETTVFCMDIRAYGKNFDKFIERAEKENGTRFIHARISSVEIDPYNDNLVVQYVEDGRLKRESFEMLVLSVGLQSTPGLRRLYSKLGIKYDKSGFVLVPAFAPLNTSRPGIFVCGTSAGPKDIPESVIDASGAASSAGVVLKKFPSKKIIVEYPPEKPVNDGDRPRVGVFVCHCGINIAGTVNVKEVVDYVATLPYVVLCQNMIFTCSQDAQKTINEKINELGLNRVVVAACTPRTHEPLFQSTLRKSGLNPYLFEFANIREQCSWVHQHEPQKATDKANGLIRMAVAKTMHLEPLTQTKLGVNKKCLVIGGGLAGMTAALDIANQGYDVEIIEKEAELGGNLRKIPYILGGERTAPFLESLIKAVDENPRIVKHTSAVIEEVKGFVGNFKTMIRSRKLEVESGKEKVKNDPSTTLGAGKFEEILEIEHGVVIVATGAQEYQPTEYLYGKNPRVITQRELEEMIEVGSRKRPLDYARGREVGSEKQETRSQKQDKNLASDLLHLTSAVMIQCVGSRDDNNAYCSRVCCSTAIKNALQLAELNPKAKIFVLYQDVRSYGMKELQYKKAREAGVIFIRYDKSEKPEVLTDGTGLVVEVDEKLVNRKLKLRPDLLILSTGIVPNKDNKFLSQLLKVPLGQDGFFLEAHVKLRPVDFATDGIFVCGLAHYPKDISETIAQAKAAASRAITILSKKEIEAEGKVSRVIESRCNGCGLCVDVCAYRAIELDKTTNIAAVNEALCKGCGTCAASCRSAAINLKGFSDEQILAVLEAM